MFAWGRYLCAVLVLAVGAAAVQPIYRVAADVLFLPGDGVALSARSGAVVWRFPRFDGQVYTDGHGLLLVAWVDAIRRWDSHLNIQPEFAVRRYTRVCRLRASNGQQLWCRDWPDVEQWTVDSGGSYWYLRSAGRLQVISVADGQPDRGFALDDNRDLTLMPLPGRGVMILSRGGRDSPAEGLVYQPGAAGLAAEALPAAVYPFRGDGRGLLFYVRERGEFFLAAPFTALFHRVHPLQADGRAFPKASLDDHGFVFTDWQGPNPILRGGTYDGHLWQAPRQAAEPQLALTTDAAIMLEPGTKLHATRLSAWSLASGQPRFSDAFAGNYPALGSADNVLVLQSDSDIRLLDAQSGVERWRAATHEGPLAAIAQSAIVFWEEGGELAGLARSNGDLLWRVRFADPIVR